jgi:glycosyltransferase involved in cell wall biosynthesis
MKAVGDGTLPRVLIVHNSYQQRGGEDTVCDTEANQLQQAGFAVETMIVSNDMIRSHLGAATIALRPGGLSSVSKELDRRVAQFRPDVVHFHNYFPLLGARGLRTVVARRVPAVMTLHNYRLLCAGAMLMRNSVPCELCLTHNRLQGLRHRCYRGSLPGTAAVTAHTELVRRMIVSNADTVRCIALTRFARNQFVAGGMPAKSLILKPNSVSDLGSTQSASERSGVIYVGRLSPEKGVVTLVEAASAAGIPLTLIGDGPLAGRLARIAGPTISMTGRLSSAETRAAMRRALAVAIPSTWFEGFPMTAVEAMEAGCMLIASDIGSLSEIVTPTTGILVPPGNTCEWQAALTKALAAPDTLAKGRSARRRFETHYSPAANVAALTTIYRDAIAATARNG